MPVIATLFIAIPFSLFNQIGFSVRFEKASFALFLNAIKRAFSIALILGSITFSIFRSGEMSFLIV